VISYEVYLSPNYKVVLVKPQKNKRSLTPLVYIKLVSIIIYSTTPQSLGS